MRQFIDKVMKKNNVCIIGLGYVGLNEVGLIKKRYPEVGYDSNPEVVKSLSKCKTQCS